jgi:hypothetical protein
MKQDHFKTEVRFYYNEANEDLFAVIGASDFNNATCYSHIGQHSTASKEYIKESKPATYAQYQELLKELINIGYNPKVISDTVVQLHRKPTVSEMMMGEGATHYIDYLLSDLIKRDGTLKNRVKDNGYIYSRI